MFVGGGLVFVFVVGFLFVVVGFLLVVVGVSFVVVGVFFFVKIGGFLVVVFVL